MTYLPKCTVRVKTEPILIALGANLAEPFDTLRSALRSLRAEAGLLRVSSPYRTAPVGGPSGQPDYINAAALLRPVEHLPGPAELLDWLLELEREHGRTRSERWAARTLDLDLLAWGERKLDLPGLNLPHPRLQERAFVLAPLAELWPGWRHPISGLSARELLARVDLSGIDRLRMRW